MILIFILFNYMVFLINICLKIKCLVELDVNNGFVEMYSYFLYFFILFLKKNICLILYEY